MSDYLAQVRKVAQEAAVRRAEMSDDERALYEAPQAFVGLHTAYVVMHDDIVLSLLDVAEAAAVTLTAHAHAPGRSASTEDWEHWAYLANPEGLEAALARLRQVVQP